MPLDQVAVADMPVNEYNEYDMLSIEDKDDYVNLDQERDLDDFKSVSMVTALTGKSAVMIGRLIDELEVEKNARQDLQREILELKEMNAMA